ncbi:MAG: TIGR04076 family protein [Ardenticatenaceae bacterium]|nr:TIGR04076 family protein [Ardenticatenaceae bacterium]HBY94762.1 TIGR04076 family protein [Chloroflexota bacterium]
MSEHEAPPADEFVLWDLRVVVESISGNCTCGMAVGDYFELKGGKLFLPDGKYFCVYALASTLPLLPAKQRPLHRADWMQTDTRIACPDPICQLVMRADRVAPRRLRHDDVSGVPLEAQGE